jgi:hypothetical protein
MIRGDYPFSGEPQFYEFGEGIDWLSAKWNTRDLSLFEGLIEVDDK